MVRSPATDNEAESRPFNAPPTTTTRRIRNAKPEEGDSRGELFHLLRTLALLVAATCAIGWLVS